MRPASLPAPPGPFRPGFWRSPLRGPWLTSFLGTLLFVLVLVVGATGFLSHAAYQPDLPHNAIVNPAYDFQLFPLRTSSRTRLSTSAVSVELSFRVTNCPAVKTK